MSDGPWHDARQHDARRHDARRHDAKQLAAEALLATIARIHARGWCLGTSGNFSVVLSEDPQRLLITVSGPDKGHLDASHLVAVGGDGRPVPGETGMPSAETLLHCAIVDAVRAGAVLHTHSVPGTLLGERFLANGGLTISGYEMLKGLAGISSHEASVRVPIFANTQDMAALAGRVRQLLAERSTCHGFLIAGHGLYTWGSDLDEARRHVEIFEFLFECLARRTTFTPYENERPSRLGCLC